VGCASDSSSAARVTLPWRMHASYAMSWGNMPCRKYRRRRLVFMVVRVLCFVKWAKVSLTKPVRGTDPPTIPGTFFVPC
jgi:hypothetical protein